MDGVDSGRMGRQTTVLYIHRNSPKNQYPDVWLSNAQVTLRNRLSWLARWTLKCRTRKIERRSHGDRWAEHVWNATISTYRQTHRNSKDSPSPNGMNHPDSPPRTSKFDIPCSKFKRLAITERYEPPRLTATPFDVRHSLFDIQNSKKLAIIGQREHPRHSTLA